jgi:hypothetical protein
MPASGSRAASTSKPNRLLDEKLARLKQEKAEIAEGVHSLDREAALGATSFECERDVQPRPKLGRWTEDLDTLLTGNAAKPAREQLTLIRIFEELRRRGYDGGYDAVRRYARRWAK